MIPHSELLAEGLESHDQRVVVVCEAVDADGQVVADLPAPTSGMVTVDADGTHRRAMSAEFPGVTALAVLSEHGVRVRVARGLRLRGASLAQLATLTAGVFDGTEMSGGVLTLVEMFGPGLWDATAATWDGTAVVWG